jgi:flagellar M-ring protein FliF
MNFTDYLNALDRRQRIGLAVGAAVIAAAATGGIAWLAHDPYVALATHVDDARLAMLVAELDRAKLPYRMNDGGDAIAVPRSVLGRAHAAIGAPLAPPPSAGLELFKDSDFATTDFAQRINYQRALQGELTRTIQALSGVRAARVHLVLPEGGPLRRSTQRASAAVHVSTQAGRTLSAAQVRGIQRLVAASVPQVKLDDVVVLDESGTSLSRMATDGEADLSSSQLDLKRQADQYLQTKLERLLADLVPAGSAAMSVDTTLDLQQLKIVTEEPVAARAQPGQEVAAGVLVKERQSQRGRPAKAAGSDADPVSDDVTDWEAEYRVGHRIEQTLQLPGSIKRLSVAVALRGAPAGLSAGAVEQLVVSGLGLERARGDSVSVLLLPEAAGREPAVADVKPAVPAAPAVAPAPAPSGWMLAAGALPLLAGVGALAWRRRARPVAAPAPDVEALALRVQAWLADGRRDVDR